MMFGKNQILLAAAILATSLWGCSSGFDAENPKGSTSAVDASVVGAGNCIGCHQTASLSTAASPQVVTDYLAGKHVVHNTNDITAASAAACLVCHDPLGDGRSLENFISSYPLSGLAAVTCETCHGAGGDHPANASAIPVPHKTPDYDRCGQCHNASVDHRTSFPEADRIVEKVTVSPHVTGVQKREARCSKCHSDEGAKLYKNVTGTPAQLITAIPDSTSALATASPVQCRTCHKAHALSLLLATDENITGSAEYNTCSNCHQPVEAYHGETSTNGLMASRVIYDTHLDNPATTDIEGYNLGPKDSNGNFGVASERVCRDCHDVHAADNTINNQWANSGHAGKIASVKAAAPLTDAVTSATGDAWLHYDWKAATSDSGRPPIYSCQRCHTATGAKNYLSSMATYDQTANDFSHVTGNAKEMLYCWACHTNNSGDLRNPGAVTPEYTVSGESFTLPDLGKSNLCATCHGGRGNGDKMKVARDTRGGFVGHHAVSAATMFSADTHLGYEYAGRSYTDSSDFRHRRIGTDVSGDADAAKFAGAISLEGTTTGPCVSCHMASSNHTFAAVTKSGTTVTAINNQALCNTCHSTDGLMTAAKINEESAGYLNATALLNLYVANTIPNHLAAAIDETVAADNDYGAFQNGKLATEDPGGFVHNSIYVKRLIFDSIDWLDNGVLDGTITIPASHTAANTWLGTTRP